MSTEVISREDAIHGICNMLCLIYGFEPIDTTDGSPNWWIFGETVGKMLDDLEGRGLKRCYPKIEKPPSLERNSG